MKTSGALPHADLLQSERRNATFVPTMSESERRNRFELAKLNRDGLPAQVPANRIFACWLYDKISNSVGLLLGEQAVVLRAHLLRHPHTIAAHTR